MPEISKEAQAYLAAVEKERQKVLAGSGQEAAKKYIDDQKRMGQNLRDSNVRQSAPSNKAGAIKRDLSDAAARRLRQQKAGPVRAKANSGNMKPGKPASSTASANPRSNQKQYQKGKGDSLFGDFFDNLAEPFKGMNRGNAKPSSDDSSNNRRRAASGGK
jgi:hypothetical protein